MIVPRRPGLLVFILAVPWALFAAQTPFEQACDRLAAGQGDDARRLHELFKVDWDYAMHESPEFATLVGYPGLNDRWSDLSLEAIARRKRELNAPIKVLESIKRANLTPIDQLNYDLFSKNQNQALEGAHYPREYLSISQMDGIQQEVARILDMAPQKNAKDYHDILARIESAAVLIDQTLGLLKKGLELRVTPPRIILRDVPDQIKNQMIEDPEQNPILRPFRSFPPSIPEADRGRLRKQAEAALKEKIIPAFGRLHDFFVTNYLPHCREAVSMANLPEGKEWYEFNVRASTTTKLTPPQIHELGLSEVKRIRQEMDALIEQTGFKGSFEEFSKFLRSDPKFYYTNADDLVRAYRDIAKRADPELAHVFGKLPRLPYGVKEIPAYAAKSQTTAYYEPGSPAAGRPGWYMVNTYALDTRPKWEMEALSLHEAVPGHHLQIALAQEMEDAPEFRKHGGYTAFVEGWGLYSESLGGEMGFYKDPYMKFGQLTYEMWRAIRLVVDTGMHAKGWSRDQAIQYFMANSSKTEHDITVEIDRYIAWPGQALAYKIGELRLKGLRAQAERELGDKFDIRVFHDQVLDQGAMPLDILEKRIRDWIGSSRQSPKPAP